VGLKDYKIVWFTEGGWQGKVSLDNPNMRNDVSTKWLLGAEHYPIFQMPQVLEHFGEKHLDFGIVTLPKSHLVETSFLILGLSNDTLPCQPPSVNQTTL
jgi:hypothetical protein